MCARQRGQSTPGTDADLSAGWRELHAAMMAGVPYASEIVKLLDSGGIRFPTAPMFEWRNADVSCYQVVHRAWRDGVLPELLRLLRTWRDAGSGLGEGASRPEFQRALAEFLRDHRSELPQLVDYLSKDPLRRTMPTRNAASVEAVRRHLDIVWADFRRRAA